MGSLLFSSMACVYKSIAVGQSCAAKALLPWFLRSVAFSSGVAIVSDNKVLLREGKHVLYLIKHRKLVAVPRLPIYLDNVERKSHKIGAAAGRVMARALKPEGKMRPKFGPVLRVALGVR